MVELRFRIRNIVFSSAAGSRRATVRPITFRLPTLEEASLLASVDEEGRILPSEDVFVLSNSRGGPVIEGFVDCALGEFVRAQLEALSSDGLPPIRCEIHGLEPFMETCEPEQHERLRDLISVCEFRTDECTPESAVRFLKDTGFFDQYIIVGVKHGRGWRRSRCITTFEGRPTDAAAILGHLADYFGREPVEDQPEDRQDDRHDDPQQDDRYF